MVRHAVENAFKHFIEKRKTQNGNPGNDMGLVFLTSNDLILRAFLFCFV